MVRVGDTVEFVQPPYPLPQSPDEFAHWAVAAGGRNPGNWIADAEALMASAHLVLDGWRASIASFAPVDLIADPPAPWKPGASPEVYMMLAGMAIEDLLKALAISTNPTLIGDGSSKPLLHHTLTGHNFISLAARAGIAVQPEEASLLDRLAGFVRWAGRYPLAKELTDTIRDDLRRIDDPVDPNRVSLIYDRLHAAAERAWRQYVATEEEAERAALEVTWTKVERWLKENAAFIRHADGTVAYEARNPTDAGAGVVCCCACGTSVTLDGRIRAASCLCSILYFIDWGFLGAPEPLPNTWKFPERA